MIHLHLEQLSDISAVRGGTISGIRIQDGLQLNKRGNHYALQPVYKYSVLQCIVVQPPISSRGDLTSKT